MTNNSIPFSLVEERQLWRITDPDKIRGLVESAIAEQNADFMGRLVAGKNKPLAKLKRQVIEGSGKRVSPEDVETSIRHVLEVGQIGFGEPFTSSVCQCQPEILLMRGE